jgi:hypothetical protein
VRTGDRTPAGRHDLDSTNFDQKLFAPENGGFGPWSTYDGIAGRTVLSQSRGRVLLPASAYLWHPTRSTRTDESLRIDSGRRSHSQPAGKGAGSEKWSSIRVLHATPTIGVHVRRMNFGFHATQHEMIPTTAWGCTCTPAVFWPATWERTNDSTCRARLHRAPQERDTAKAKLIKLRFLARSESSRCLARNTWQLRPCMTLNSLFSRSCHLPYDPLSPTYYPIELYIVRTKHARVDSSFNFTSLSR